MPSIRQYQMNAFQLTTCTPTLFYSNLMNSYLNISCYARRQLLIFLSLTVASLGTGAAGEIRTKTASISAPKELPLAAAAAIMTLNEQTLAQREGELAQRQKRLEQHHHAPPIRRAEKGLALRVEPQTISPTALNSTQTSIKMLLDRILTTQETAAEVSTVCEPSIAIRGDEVLITGNWFGSFSKNATSAISTFKAIDPDKLFPVPESGLHFCCDQIAIYDPKSDTMFWLLQYDNNESGNILRLAVATKDDIKNQRWRYYDLSPQAVGKYTNEWFDFPACALGAKFLYFTINTFKGDSFVRSVAMRIPLDKLGAYQGFDLDYFDTTKDFGDTGEAFSLCPVQGASDTMYAAAHVDTGKLRVYTWPEAGDTVSTSDVEVQAWSSDQATSPSPQGADWLKRTDPRITAGWLSKDTIGFAWTAAKDATFKFPHVRVAILNGQSKQVVEQPHIYSREFAYAYPAAAPNANGEVGIVVDFGGDKINPSAAVGVLKKQSGTAQSTWDLATAVAGKAFPRDGKWGDYLTLRLDGKNAQNWVASTFVLENNGSSQVSYHVFSLK